MRDPESNTSATNAETPQREIINRRVESDGVADVQESRRSGLSSWWITSHALCDAEHTVSRVSTAMVGERE